MISKWYKSLFLFFNLLSCRSHSSCRFLLLNAVLDLTVFIGIAREVFVAFHFLGAMFIQVVLPALPFSAAQNCPLIFPARKRNSLSHKLNIG